MSTTSTATAQTATKSEQLRVLQSHHDNNEPLPSDLKKILTEVAQYGGCSWLSWSTEQQQHHHYMNNLNNSPYRFHIKRSPPKRRHRPQQQQRTNSNAINTSSTTNGANASSTSSANKRLRQNNHASASPSIVIPLLSGAGASDSVSNCSYECDSEGTSSVSEMSSSGDHRRHNHAMRYKTLAKAVSAGIASVLDHFFRTNGGYKPTSAEICQYQNSQMKQQQLQLQATTSPPETVIFQQRKQRLVQAVLLHRDGPPFTIQRLAEVMIDPSRYYKQTHKLCNCLEKLLLVTSSIHAFGGSTGGTTSQSRQEERELAALADERERQEKSEQENRRLRRRVQSESSSDLSSPSNKQHLNEIAQQKKIHDIQVHQAKVGLRHKFEPGGDNHQHDSSPNNSPTNSPTKKRSLTSSPPPPSFSQHDLQHRAPSPILFATDGARLSPERNAHLLHIQHHNHHRNTTSTGMLNEDLPLDVVRIHNNQNTTNNTVGSKESNQSTNTKENNLNSSATTKDTSDADTEIEPGRSSASNSDVEDSESDISLDDSASDGSDCGEQPFSAARLRALNRKQQQQRLQQSRVQMLVGEFAATSRSTAMEAQAEYQSGDSIDSTMAEDSGGSDSSSSDLAD